MSHMMYVLVRGAKLNIPPFVRNHQQLSKKNVIIPRKIASLRIHVERAIGRVNSLPTNDAYMRHELP